MSIFAISRPERYVVSICDFFVCVNGDPLNIIAIKRIIFSIDFKYAVLPPDLRYSHIIRKWAPYNLDTDIQHFPRVIPLIFTSKQPAPWHGFHYSIRMYHAVNIRLYSPLFDFQIDKITHLWYTIPMRFTLCAD